MLAASDNSVKIASAVDDADDLHRVDRTFVRIWNVSVKQQVGVSTSMRTDALISERRTPIRG